MKTSINGVFHFLGTIISIFCVLVTIILILYSPILKKWIPLTYYYSAGVLVIQWIYGFTFSLFFGYFIVRSCKLIFDYIVFKKTKIVSIDKIITRTKKAFSDSRERPWLVGLIERFFFTLGIAFNISGAVIAMIAWMTIKSGTTYPWAMFGSRTGESQNLDPKTIRLSSSYSLLTGLVSMLFALIGGLICNGSIPISGIISCFLWKRQGCFLWQKLMTYIGF